MAPDNRGSERQELTAYVVGELGDDEKTVLELEFDRDATLRTERDELRTISDLIARELGEDEVVGLTSRQRKAILKAAEARGSSESGELSLATGPARQVQPARSAPSRELPRRDSAPAREPDLWERLELLVVFLALLGVGFALPHLPTGIGGLVARIGQRWGTGGGEEGEVELFHGLQERLSELGGFLDGGSPGYFRASVLAAAAAVGIYVWGRLRLFQRKPMPSGFIVAVVCAYAGVLVLILWLKG